MGQFLQRLLHAHIQYPHFPPDHTELHRHTDETHSPSSPASPPATLALKSSRQIGVDSTKSRAESPDVDPNDVPSEGFEMSQKRQQTSTQPDGQQLVLPQVDAISKSKSTSSGTRRVYKVVRVAPSNFYSLSKRAHQSNINPPASPREGEPQQQQQPQQQPHQQQTRKIDTKSKSNKPPNN